MTASGAGPPSWPALGRHQRIALDANVLIALLEDQSERADRAAAVVDAIEAGLVEGTAASVLLTEILTGFARLRDVARFNAAYEELTGLGLEYVPITNEVAVEAAWLRADRAVSFPDALHLSAARAGGCTAFVTNDRRIRSTIDVEVIYLDDLVPDSS